MRLGFDEPLIHRHVLGARVVMGEAEPLHQAPMRQFDTVLRRSMAEASGTRIVHGLRVLTILDEQVRAADVPNQITRKPRGALVIREEHEDTPSRPLFETVRHGVFGMHGAVHPHDETLIDRELLAALERELPTFGISPLEDVHVVELETTHRMDDKHLRANRLQVVSGEPMLHHGEVDREERRPKQELEHLPRTDIVLVRTPHTRVSAVDVRMTSQRDAHGVVVMVVRHQVVVLQDATSQQRIGVRNRARTTIHRQTVTLRNTIRDDFHTSRVASIPDIVRAGDRHRPPSTPELNFHETSGLHD